MADREKQKSKGEFRMKRILSSFIAMFIIVCSSLNPIYAAENDSNEIEALKQENIDSLFDKINELVLEKNQINFYSEYARTYGQAFVPTSNLRSEEIVNKEREEIDRQLSYFGMKKIDPNNKNDMILLEELQEAYISNYDAIDDMAPDFSAMANLYSIYIYNGNYNYNNSTFRYRYIRVVDDKGYDGLTTNVVYNAIPAGRYPGTSILNYNFGYILSSFLGTTPVGMVVDWTLGNIFNIFNNMPSDVILSGGEDFYLINCISVSVMTYYYVYNSGWKQIGTGTSIKITKSDWFSGNVNGEPVSEKTENENWTSRSPVDVWYKFIELYADNMDLNPYYCTISSIGSFKIQGYNKTFDFEPKFAKYPIELI